MKFHLATKQFVLTFFMSHHVMVRIAFLITLFCVTFNISLNSKFG